MNEDKTLNTPNAGSVPPNLPVNETAPVQSAPPTPVSPAAPAPKASPGQKPIRTYESDVAEALAMRKTSITSMALAENKRREGSESISTAEPKNNSRKVLMIILSLLLVAGGLVGAYYLYLQSPFATPPPENQLGELSSLILPDKKIYLTVGTENGDKFIASIYAEFNKNLLPARKILELILEKNTPEDKENPSARISGSEFIESSGVEMPDMLLRSLTDRFMLGTYTEENGQKTPFVALTTDFFQNAFAGMLSWESAMAEDLADLLNYRQRSRALELNKDTTIISPTPVATSTATSTKSALATSTKPSSATSTSASIINKPSPVSFFNIYGQFVDRQILNRDVREFRNSDGYLLFLYSFINKETMIITTTESALIEAITRIENQTYVR